MSAFEALVAVALIGGSLGAAAAYQMHIVHRARALALRADLRSLRAAVEFFHTAHNRYPATLEEVLVEPAFLLLMGGLVAFIMASVLLPLFRMINVIH